MQPNVKNILGLLGLMLLLFTAGRFLRAADAANPLPSLLGGLPGGDAHPLALLGILLILVLLVCRHLRQ